jgi:aspartate/methionine/tyrosine aminotransferase
MGQALAGRVLRHLEPVRSVAANEVIDLTKAEPAPTPDHIGRAAELALDQGETHYTDASGVQPLRTAIADHLETLGFPVEPESIGVTNGGTEALYIALQVALKPGDTALVVEPMSRHIVDMIDFIGARPERVETSATNGFVPDPAAIGSTNARALLVASPSPITGKRIPDGELERLVAAAREQGMAAILDLSYAAGQYDPRPVRFENPKLVEEIVLAGSFSTAHGLSGWRIGFFSAPAADRALLYGLKTAMSICTTAVSQFAAVAALGEPREWFEERRAHFADHRDWATGKLAGAGLRYIKPDAFPPLLIDVAHLGGGDSVADRLAERNVIVEPGSSFGTSTVSYIRINLGAPRRALHAGIRSIIELHNEAKIT